MFCSHCGIGDAQESICDNCVAEKDVNEVIKRNFHRGYPYDTIMTSFAHQKNLCKWGWGGSEIRLAIINCKRRTDFAPTERPRCCGWIFSNYFFGTFQRPNCMARVTQNLKVDPSCHNTNVFQIGTRINVSFTHVIAFFKVKPSCGTNNSSLL